MTTVVQTVGAVTVQAGSAPTIVASNPSVTVSGSDTPVVSATGSTVTVSAGSTFTLNVTSTSVTVSTSGAGSFSDTLVQQARPHVGSIRFYGDSYLDNDEEGPGADGRNFVASLITRALGVPDGRSFNDARASTVSSWYTGPQVLRRFNPGTPGTSGFPETAHSAHVGAAVIWSGRNDVAWLGSGTTAGHIFKSGMTAAASRYRAAKVYAHSDASVAYTGTWSTPTNSYETGWTTSTYALTTTVGDEFTITTKDTMGLFQDSATVALCFMGAQHGATASVYLDGTLHGQLDMGRGVAYGTATSQVWGNGDSIAVPYVYRLSIPTTAATDTTTTTHTIRVEMDALVGASYGLRFDSWWVEAPYPPPVFILDLCHSSNAESIWDAIDTDSVIDAYNGFIDTVCLRFSDGLVRKVETGAVLEGLADGSWTQWSNAWAFQTDGLHPSEAGGAEVAMQVVRAVQQVVSDGYGERLLAVDTRERDAVLTGYTAVADTYTVLDSDDVVNCTTGTFTVTLPDAANRTGRRFTIRNSGAGTITLDGDSSDTINGSATATISAGTAVTVCSTGSNWITL